MKKKDLNETTEFFTPKEGWSIENYIEANDRSGTHHLARYAWANTILPESGKLLDIACGAGYGAYTLALQHPDLEIYGIDYDERAIEYAKENYQAPNLKFELGNIVEWKYFNGANLGVFDIIISFDTIEHLLHREIALINFAENLSKNGILLFSTPCGHAEPLLNPGWEHHKIEYSANVLLNLFSRFFRVVKYPDNNSLTNYDFWLKLNTPTPIYLNRMNPIVCSDPIKLFK
jgi:2-polyprenyl-3-methyl-5-hydroxy-6-metoxy-1,4-benzoquinol methylase